MTGDTLFFLLLLLVFAVLLGNETILLVLYLLGGGFFLSRWWSGQSLKALNFARRFTPRAFIGERIPVRLEIRNTSWLPAIWLQVQDGLPVELAGGKSYRRVISLAPGGLLETEYWLRASKRGCYQVGPFSAGSGDIFGFSAEQQRVSALPPEFHSSGPPLEKKGRIFSVTPGWEAETLIVYPRVYPMTKLELPSRSPLGTLRHHQPIYEDPTRVRTKREYVAGDSLRRVDWKATASTGQMQVKQYEPSIALDTVILLNLLRSDYDLRSVYDVSELAIALAASVANQVVSQKQAVGLVTNGSEATDTVHEWGTSTQMPSTNETRIHEYDTNTVHAKGLVRLPVRKGQGSLMRVLETLARIDLAEGAAPLGYLEMLNQERVRLAWGTTVALVTPLVNERLMEEIFQYRRSGLNVALFLVGVGSGYSESSGAGFSAQRVKELTKIFQIPFYHLLNEAELQTLA